MVAVVAVISVAATAEMIGPTSGVAVGVGVTLGLGLGMTVGLGLGVGGTLGEAVHVGVGVGVGASVGLGRGVGTGGQRGRAATVTGLASIEATTKAAGSSEAARDGRTGPGPPGMGGRAVAAEGWPVGVARPAKARAATDASAAPGPRTLLSAAHRPLTRRSSPAHPSGAVVRISGSRTRRDAMSTTSTSLDPAQTAPYRLANAGQAAAALVFSLAPLLITATYASVLGFQGDDPLIYRLGGAATLGYAVVALIALVRPKTWDELMIPSLATFAFALGAFGASLVELLLGAQQPVVPFVVVAGAGFTVIAGVLIARAGLHLDDRGAPLVTGERLVIGLAALSAATFGVLPLLAPQPFAQVFGLPASDAWVFRLAGAGCLGYAVAGVASLRVGGWRAMRLQNIAAITFNSVAAVAAWLAVANGDGGWLAPIVALAATFFAVALTVSPSAGPENGDGLRGPPSRASRQ